MHSNKFQGLSLDMVVISFNILKQRSFNYGQMYVSLSRMTSFNGMLLTGEYKSNAIKADPRAINEHERSREHNVIKPIADCGIFSDTSFIVTLLHTLFETDVLCLTETQLPLNHAITENIAELKFVFSS